MELTEIISPTPDERRFAMLAHVLQISVSFWAPLVIYLVKRDSRFVRFHAIQALFLQIALVSVLVAAWAGIIIVALLIIFLPPMAVPKVSNQFPAGMLGLAVPVWLLCLGGWALLVALEIVFGFKAYRGEWAEYPIIGRWARRLAG